MSDPTHAPTSPGSAPLSSFRGPPVGEPSSRPMAESPDHERRLRAQERRQRFLAVCQRELARRDAEQDARGE